MSSARPFFIAFSAEGVTRAEIETKLQYVSAARGRMPVKGTDDTEQMLFTELFLMEHNIDDDEDALEFGSTTSELLIAKLVDRYGSAFEGDAEGQKDFLAYTELFAFVLQDISDADPFASLQCTYMDAEENALGVFLCFFVEVEEHIAMLTLMCNENLVSPSNEPFARFLDWAEPLDAIKFIMDTIMNVVLAPLDGDTSALVIPDAEVSEIRCFQHFDYAEDQKAFQFMKLFSMFLTDVSDSHSKFYRILKPTRLFTIDDIVFKEEEHIAFYTTNDDVAALIEDADFEFLDEDDPDNSILTGIVDDFGPEDTSVLELIVATQRFTDLSLNTDTLVETSVESTTGMKEFKFSELGHAEDAQRRLFDNGRQIFDLLTERFGQLTLHKNGVIDEEQLNDNPYIETNFGTLNLTDMPIWVILFAIPYTVYCMNVYGIGGSYEELEEDENWFEQDAFKQYVDYIAELSEAQVN